jgi:hypothetical protein
LFINRNIEGDEKCPSLINGTPRKHELDDEG